MQLNDEGNPKSDLYTNSLHPIRKQFKQRLHRKNTHTYYRQYSGEGVVSLCVSL